jgi:hypothetical protein
MKYPHWCNNPNIYQYFQSQPTHTLYKQFYFLATSLALNSGHHQARIKEYDYIQKLSNVSWRSPAFTLKIY